MKSWSLEKDPFAGREAQKYDKPIPSREFILQVLEQRKRPLTHGELCQLLALTDEEQIEALRRRLRAMERDGQLLSTRRGAYGLIDKMELIRGTIQGHRDGYGFVLPEDGSDDLYLAARQMRRVFDGDRVLARVAGIDRRGRREGVIVEVLERNTHELVGRYFEEDGIGFVVPDNQRLNQEVLIPAAAASGARHGQIVHIAITEQPGPKNRPKGRVIEVLGDHLAPGMEIDVALRSHEIPHQFPPAVLAEVAGLEPEQVADSDKVGRVDLRQLPFVTIDGEDAKDFDDAVFCERKRWGSWRLYVAIADVSHYVRPGTALDQEAYVRGNSVYFPGQVIPMLPEVLSNGLCSLNPGVDRLAMICEMSVSANGTLSRYKFYEGVIRSHARLTYTQVGAILQEPESDAGQAWRQQYQPLVPHLEALHRLYRTLRKARDERGAIDFETTETRIIFGPERKIERIVPVERNDAHKLIEECMLCANVAAARFLLKHKLGGVYRVHEGPSAEKLENLRAFLGELGLSLGGGDKPRPADYQRLMDDIAGRPDQHLIQTVMLRSLSQALYQPENVGHFGLDYPAYTHFTSPIRRYPDLLVHRAIRSMIRAETATNHVVRLPETPREPPARHYPYTDQQLLELGEHCSMTERRADDAVRDVEAWLKCEYIQSRVGDVFHGVISAVTSFGLFVELDEVYVEGLVHITALKSDYYRYDPVKHRLRGERSGVVYRLGDPVDVIVTRVDLDEKKIDLELLQEPSRSRAKKRSYRKGAEARAERIERSPTEREPLPVDTAKQEKAGKKNTKKKAAKSGKKKSSGKSKKRKSS